MKRIATLNLAGVYDKLSEDEIKVLLIAWNIQTDMKLISGTLPFANLAEMQNRLDTYVSECTVWLDRDSSFGYQPKIENQRLQHYCDVAERLIRKISEYENYDYWNSK